MVIRNLINFFFFVVVGGKGEGVTASIAVLVVGQRGSILTPEDSYCTSFSVNKCDHFRDF